MITPELIAALDDLIQAGARASSALRARLEQVIQSDRSVLGSLNQVAVSQGVLNEVSSAPRDEQSVPRLLVQARDAVQRLATIAGKFGDSETAQMLSARAQSVTQQMQAAGVGTNWFVILGIGAGLIAAYMLWEHYGKGTRTLAMFDRPEPDNDVRPQLRGMRRALGTFNRFGAAPRRLGSGPRKGFGDKYEFEPEIRLEGIRNRRGAARSRR